MMLSSFYQNCMTVFFFLLAVSLLLFWAVSNCLLLFVPYVTLWLLQSHKGTSDKIAEETLLGSDPLSLVTTSVITHLLKLISTFCGPLSINMMRFSVCQPCITCVLAKLFHVRDVCFFTLFLSALYLISPIMCHPVSTALSINFCTNLCIVCPFMSFYAPLIVSASMFQEPPILSFSVSSSSSISHTASVCLSPPFLFCLQNCGLCLFVVFGQKI